MRPVALVFEDGTFRYAQLTRVGMWALYEQRHKASRVCRFEVVRLRIKAPSTAPSGAVVPEREAYPTAHAWGDDGFTFFTREAAETALAQHTQVAAEATL